MYTLFKKEFRSYFLSPIAYIYLGVFLFFTGIYFVFTNLFGMNTSFNLVLSELVLIFLFISPIITMKILSEEQRSKTDQLLYTSPQSITSIILGKFVAAFALFLVGALITVIYPIILSRFGTVVISEIISSYVGFILVGGAFISIGMLISALTENQVASAVSTLGVLLVIWFMDSITQTFPQDSFSGLIFTIVLLAIFVSICYLATKEKIISGIIAIGGGIALISMFLINRDMFYGIIPNFFEWFSLVNKTMEFSNGLVPLTSISYYVSFTFVMILITIKTIEKRRWS